MHLTKLLLNPLNRDTVRDLASPSDLHKTLCRAFPDAAAGGPGRVLFRVEPSDDESSPSVVLVQSEKEPDWSRLPAAWGRACAVKPFDPEPAMFPPGRTLRFRLLANPTRKREGKRHGLFREEDQRAWLLRKAANAGFALDANADSVRLVPLGTARSGRGDGRRSWFGVRFDGRLTVTDPAMFCETLRSGLGSGKAFGFGLLSVGPP